MTTVGRGVLFAVAFVAALVAVAFGLRKLRGRGVESPRGPFPALRRAFWMAAGTILGGSAACHDDGEGYLPTCYVATDYSEAREDVGGDDGADDSDAGPGRDVEVEDAAVPDYPETSCYLPTDYSETRDDTGGDDGAFETGEAEDEDAAGEAADEDGDAEASDEDAGDASEVNDAPDVPADADEVVGAAPRRPMSREERRARRVLLRAAAVERLLADPGTHPAVREVLAVDAAGLRRVAARVRRGA